MKDPLADPLQQPVDTRNQGHAFGAADGSPKFGRLLLVLAIAVLLMELLTFVSESNYS